ncbi:MAG: hypothetical protein AAB071_01535 [Bacteroidota bacterium]
MAKLAKKIKRNKLDESIPFNAQNYIILGAGLLFITIGYIFLSKSDVAGFIPLVLSPILLIIGYCVLIPFGIMYRKREKISEESIQNN